MFAIWSVWRIGDLLRSRRAEARSRWRRRVFVIFGRSACRILGVRLEVHGTPAPAPAFVVSNHLSYLDIVVLAACMETIFVSKAEVDDWPLIGVATRSMDTIFVQREQKRGLPSVNRQIRAALDRGDRVLVFPEGTSTNGAQLRRFKASLLAPATEGDLPVHYASLTYRTASGDPPASEAVCWWGEMEFAPHLLGLLGLRRIDARVDFGTQAVRGPDRKLLAEKLWRAIREIFIPVA
jgi:1-acyl-sn-glycerol-3-phosphate acyltransferase